MCENCHSDLNQICPWDIRTCNDCLFDNCNQCIACGNEDFEEKKVKYYAMDHHIKGIFTKKTPLCQKCFSIISTLNQELRVDNKYEIGQMVFCCQKITDYKMPHDKMVQLMQCIFYNYFPTNINEQDQYDQLCQNLLTKK